MKFPFRVSFATMTLRFELKGSKTTLENGNGDGIRLGKLLLTRGGKDGDSALSSTTTIDTPNFFKYTRHGLQPHLVREVETELGPMPAATRIQMEDFLGVEPNSLPNADGKLLHQFVALNRTDILLLDTLDPTATQRTAKSSNSCMCIDTEGGVRRLSPEEFAQFANAMNPDIVVPPADYVEEPLPSLTQGKRISKSVSRSSKWLQECLSKLSALGNNMAVFAPLMGSHSPELRKISAKTVAEQSNVAGYVFNDACLNIPFEQKLEHLSQSLAYLDDSKPRYMVGASPPDAVVRSVLKGIDLFDSSYPYAVTEQGFASIYYFGPGDALVAAPVPMPTHLDLWQDPMFNDFAPLVKDCQCYTCRNHHRSYIHHLLKTKEMLATVLLQLHNMHCYQQLFASIRQSIATDTFAKDAEQFLERYGCKSSAAMSAKRPFGELETLSIQESSPTTKVQRKRHIE